MTASKFGAPLAGVMLPTNCRRRRRRCFSSVVAKRCMAHGLAEFSGTATRRWQPRNGCRCQNRQKSALAGRRLRGITAELTGATTGVTDKRTRVIGVLSNVFDGYPRQPQE